MIFSRNLTQTFYLDSFQLEDLLKNFFPQDVAIIVYGAGVKLSSATPPPPPQLVETFGTCFGSDVPSPLSLSLSLSLCLTLSLTRIS